jgi:cellobiose epimerase
LTTLNELAPLSVGPNDGEVQRALTQLEAEARAELDRISDWWTTHSPAPDGGYFGEIGEDGTPHPTAPRSIILNTRLLWFFSNSFAFTQNEACGKQADRAYQVLLDQFLDPKTHSFIWMVSANGEPLNTRKQTYAQAFGVYALAAYARASNKLDALERALETFTQIQVHFMDPVHGGWLEALGPNLEPIDDVRLSARDQNSPKSMNTHLHVLEAYTALYETLVHLAPDHARLEAVRSALDDAFDIFNRHIVSARKDRLGLFFDMDWTSQSSVRSFGHDIEASWLVYEAGIALRNPDREAKAKEAALGLAHGALQGLSEFGGLYEEIGQDGHLSRLHVWWIQAEAMVGFLNAYALNHDPVFLKSALGVWDFIKAHQRDSHGGEWLELARLDDQISKAGLMVGPWKCPYHTGRAMMETIRLCQSLRAPAP